jgi:hypothetical protein
MADKSNSHEPQEFPLRIPPSGAAAFEKHYSVKELAGIWGFSERTIRRMFADESGVLEWTQEETRSKRGYRTWRIPESVALRVHRKMRRVS